MRRFRVLLIIGPALLVGASLAAPRSAWATGTHFLVQLQAGLATPPLDHLDVSLGYGFAAGFGGRLGGTPIRFYGVVGFDRAAFSAAGTHPHTGAHWSTQRSYNDIHAGFRMVVPVVWQLRWYLEGLAGASFLEGTVERQDAPSLSKDDWSALIAGATGLEIRWHPHLATGIRGEVRWMLADADPLAAAIADPGAGTVRFSILIAQAVMF